MQSNTKRIKQADVLSKIYEIKKGASSTLFLASKSKILNQLSLIMV